MRNFPKNLIISALSCLALPALLFADYGTSGWTVFKKLDSAIPPVGDSISPSGSGLVNAVGNPALLGFLRQSEVVLFSEAGIAQDIFGGFIYGEQLHKSALMAGIAYYDAGSIELNWFDSGVLMTENKALQQDYLAFVGYGYRLSSRLSVGGTVKAATSQLVEKNRAYARAADAGLAFQPFRHNVLSFAVRNAGESTAFISVNDPLPLTVSLSDTHVWRTKNRYGAITAGATYDVTDQRYWGDVGFSAGVPFFIFTAGYRVLADDLNIRLGFSFNSKEFTLSYLLLPAIYTDYMHRLTLSYRFAPKRPPSLSADFIRRGKPSKYRLHR